MSEEEFGLQCPPPWMHLKRILANYPEGTSIFKEALQNADDAGATTFKIILDHRQLADLACESFPERFTGPSLLFYNDGIFTEPDWSSLRTMFQSHKLADAAEHTESTAARTYIGKYGMGSRSFFHLTDLLMAVSGDTYAYIDPDEIISKAGGGKIHYTKKGSHGSTKIPLKSIQGIQKFDLERSFAGTIFRLPLRQGRFARSSRFAPYEYDVLKTARLMSSFSAELGDCLLFLNNVSCVELLEIEDKPSEPRLMSRCKLQRAPCRALAACEVKFDSFRWEDGSKSHDSANNGFRDEYVRMQYSIKHAEDVEHSESHWLVCEERDLDSIIKSKPSTSIKPVIGVALRLLPVTKVNEPGLFSDDFDSGDKKSEHLDVFCWPANEVGAGQLFNYLPIPDALPTGLPFQVHGSFYLTENRRDLWLSTEAEGIAELWSDWNRTLLTKALPNLLAILYKKHFIRESENPRIPLDVTPVFRFWPDLNKLPLQLKPIVSNLCEACVDKIPQLKSIKFLRLAETTVNALLDLKALWSSSGSLACPSLKNGGDQSAEREPNLASMLQVLCIITSRSGRELVCAAPQRFYSSFQGATYMSFLTAMYHHILPHWLNNVGFNQLVLREKYFVPWMFILCQTLSGCSADEIQRFGPRCKNLRFVPCRSEQNLPSLGVMPDEEWLDECGTTNLSDNQPLTQVTLRTNNQDWVLLQPAAVYDSSLRTFRVTSGGIPAGPFSAPGVSRVLRTWGMKPTLTWSDMTQELVLRICQNRT